MAVEVRFKHSELSEAAVQVYEADEYRIREDHGVDLLQIWWETEDGTEYAEPPADQTATKHTRTVGYVHPDQYESVFLAYIDV